MSDLSTFIKQIPPFTRYMTGLTFTMSLFMTYGILSPYNVILVYESVLKKF